MDFDSAPVYMDVFKVPTLSDLNLYFDNLSVFQSARKMAWRISTGAGAEEFISILNCQWNHSQITLKSHSSSLKSQQILLKSHQNHNRWWSYIENNWFLSQRVKFHEPNSTYNIIKYLCLVSFGVLNLNWILLICEKW